MALDGVLANIPGLAGYLGMEEFRQRQSLGGLQGAMSVLQAVRQHDEAQRQAQMAPLQQRLMAAQAGQAEGLAQDRAEADAFNKALPGLVAQSQTPEGQIDFGRLSGALMQTPGGLKPGMDLRRTEEDRAARVQQAQALVEQRAQQATMLHETRLAQAQTAAERATETARHNRTMEGLTQQLRNISAQNAGNRQYPIINTATGIFERRPEGNVPLMDPSGQPLRPPSITSGDRQDTRLMMSIYDKTENDPQVKVFKTISPKFDASFDYFTQVQKDPTKQSNASDLAMVKTYVSMIHPKGDQISNLDMKNIAQLPGIDERIVGAVQNVLDGKQLQPKMRGDLMATMARQFNTLNTQVVGIEDRRRSEAQQFGLDPEKSVPKVGRRQTTPTSSDEDLVRAFLKKNP